MTLATVPLPLRSRTLSNDQRRAGRDAGVLAARIFAVAREDAGHVRAMAEIVEPRQARDDGGEIFEERDVLEIVVIERRPRIDDRDFDAGAGVSEVGAREERAGRRSTCGSSDA